MPSHVSDEVFKKAGQKPGIEIWRIEKFKVVPVPKIQYGNFFSGDSYLVLNTKGSSEWDIHYWIGKDSTQDEYGAVAIKAVELDDSLNGLPVQYREVQAHESPLFSSYFKSGIKYLDGGVETGFNHVTTPDYAPRLFQCKGKRNVRCWQVSMCIDSLNAGDVFVLDGGREIYVWMPPHSGRLERLKGIDIGRSIRDNERAGRGNIHVVDWDWKSHEGFFKRLGSAPLPDIKPPEAGGVDGTIMRKNKDAISLWKVSDQSGEMKIKKVGDKDLTSDLLDSSDAFILDAGLGGLYVWVGKNCTMEERNKAMMWATNYLKEMGRPSWTNVVRVIESAEPAVFNQWFSKPPPGRLAFETKLFQCSHDPEDPGLRIDQIVNFKQSDLDGDDVMILDTHGAVFVWVGYNANESEKKNAIETAKKYLATDGVVRPKGAKIVELHQGEHMPADFTREFPDWDPVLAKKMRTAEEEKKKLEAV